MYELAASAEQAVASVLERAAGLGLESRGNRALPQFPGAVGEGALRAEGALALFPASAQLCFVLQLEVVAAA